MQVIVLLCNGTRQASGKPCVPKSIYALSCRLLRIVRSSGVVHNFLDKSDVRFHELHQTLDTVCSDLHSKCVGGEKKSDTVISFEDEELVWKSYVLGFDTPKEYSLLLCRSPLLFMWWARTERSVI